MNRPSMQIGLGIALGIGIGAAVALILGSSQSSAPGITQTRNSKIAEMELDAGDMVITGSKTVQVEVKEQ